MVLANKFPISYFRSRIIWRLQSQLVLDFLVVVAIYFVKLKKTICMVLA